MDPYHNMTKKMFSYKKHVYTNNRHIKVLIMGSFYVGLVNFVASPYEKLHLERQMFIS
jgi:hypothetical protein